MNQKFGVYDIESNNWVFFEVMGFFDGKEYRTFNSVQQFLDAIEDRKYRGWSFYAHNGGRFDTSFLLEECLRRYHCSFVPRQGSIIVMTCHRKTKGGERVPGAPLFRFLDSYALLPQKLKSLGEAFDTEHKKMDEDVSKGFSRNNKRQMEYLANDCYCLYEVLTSFFESEYVVHPKLTIASQALDTFRSKFLGEHHLEQLNVHQEEYFRKHFYSGGRVEVFKGGGTGIHVYDVNSLFPFAMLSEMPTGNCYNTETYKKGCIGFYRVQVKSTPDWYISPLLVKAPLGKLGTTTENYYVKGPGEYYLSSAMIEHLREVHGVKCLVKDGIYFKGKAHLFNDYVETFFKLKQENRGNALYLISKLFLNALYGRLGLKRQRERLEQLTDEIFWNRDFDMFSEEHGLVLILEESKSRFILPYLAGYITDLARLHHFRLMNLSPESIYYCDTDSIFSTDSRTFDKFVGPQIGQLSYLGKWDGVFIAPKTYALKQGTTEKICFKGFQATKTVKGKQINLFTFSQFERAIRGEIVLTEKRERILSAIECMQFNKTSNSKRKIVHDAGKFLKVAVTEKFVRAKYDKREVLPAAGKRIFNTECWQWADVMKPGSSDKNGVSDLFD